MVDSALATFTDVDEYNASIYGVRAESVVTLRGDFRVKWTGVRLDRLSIQRSEETLPRVANQAVDPKLCGILFATRQNQPSAHFTGVEVPPSDLVFFGVSSQGHNRIPAAYHWGSISLTHAELAAAGELLLGRELTAPSVTQRIRLPSDRQLRLANLNKAVAFLAETAPDILAKPEVARAMEQALAEAMVASVALEDAADIRSAPHHHWAVMRRLEEFLEANLDKTIYLQELCKAAAVPYSTLRNYCQEQLGTSPKRYLWLRRMHLARRALHMADPAAATVTDIATAYGFWELGRFSVAYRAMFGELPSASLRQMPPIHHPTLRPDRPSRLGESA